MRSGLILSLLIFLCAPVGAAMAAQGHRHHATAHSTRALTTGPAGAWAYSPAGPARPQPLPHYDDQPEPGHNPYAGWGG
jgi:hypothetical protein